MAVADPIPETPTAESTAAVAPVVPAEPTSASAPESPSTPAMEATGTTTDSSIAGFDTENPNLRRILYVGLIVLIGGLAFYFTRPSKKKVDMLDVTTGQTAAPSRFKLGGSTKTDTQRKNLG